MTKISKSTLTLAILVMFVLLNMSTSVFAIQYTTIDMATVSAGGTGYTYASNAVTITTGGTYIITGSTTTKRVIVAIGVTATIILSDATIDRSGDATYSDTGIPLYISGTANATLKLDGTNILNAGQQRAALQLVSTSTVTIQDGDAAGTGSLTATGGDSGAGMEAQKELIMGL